MALSATAAHAVSCAIPDDPADVAAGKITAAAAWNGTAAHTVAFSGKVDATQLDLTITPTWTGVHTWTTSTQAINVTSTLASPGFAAYIKGTEYALNLDSSDANNIKLGFSQTGNLRWSAGVGSGQVFIFNNLTTGTANNVAAFTFDSGNAITFKSRNAATATSTDNLTHQGLTSGTAAAGFCSAWRVQLQDAGGVARDASRITTALTVATSGSISSKITFDTAIAGTLTTGLTIVSGCAVRPPTTVAGLPAASAALAGAMAWVTDATATTFMSTVAGGGANKVPVSCDGTNWVIG